MSRIGNRDNLKIDEINLDTSDILLGSNDLQRKGIKFFSTTKTQHVKRHVKERARNMTQIHHQP